MKIRSIHIDGFGLLRNCSLELSGPVTVIYGPNEAGKSTLMGFIRSVLFGIPTRANAGERYEPPGGGAHGGSLVLETDEGELVRVTRRVADSAGKGRSPAGGAVTVTLPDGTSGGEELLQPLLGGVSGEQFRNLFAFSLTELQELRTLTGDELGSYLYSAGLGVKASAVLAAERKLTQEMEALYKPRGKNQELNRVLQAAAELEADFRRSKAAAGRYNEMTDESERLEAGIAAAERELAGVRTRLAFLEAASQAREHWLRRETVRRELRELPAFASFPEEAVRRLDGLLEERERLAAQADSLVARIRHLESERDAAAETSVRDGEVLSRRSELELLLEQAGSYRSAVRQADELRAETAQVQELLEQVLRQLGDGWSEPQLAAQAVTVQRREEAREWRERFVAVIRAAAVAEAEAAELGRGAEEAAGRRRELESEREAWRRKLAVRFPEEAREQARGLSALIRELRGDIRQAAALRQELAHLEQRERELLLARQAADPQRGGADTAAAALRRFAWLTGAVALALPGALLALGEPLPAAAGFVLLAALAGSMAVLGRSRSPSSAKRGRGRGLPLEDSAQDPWQRRRQDIAGDLARLSGQALRRLQTGAVLPDIAKALAASGGTAPDPLDESWPDRLEQAADEWAEALRELERREERWREADRSAADAASQQAAAETKLAQARAEVERLQEDWRRWLSGFGISAAMSPETVPELFRLLDEGHGLLARKRKLGAALDTLLGETERFAADVCRLLGLEARADIPLALKQWKFAAEQAEERQRQRREREQELAGLHEERQAVVGAAARNEDRLRALLAEAGADNEETFRQLAAQFQRRNALEEERKRLDALLEAAIGSSRLEDLNGLLRTTRAQELADELRSMEREAERLQQLANDLRDRKGRLSGELAKLTEGAEHADKLQRLEEEKARIREHADRWAVLALCAGLFRKARETYERERQPGVLKRASEYVSVMTEGRYRRVLVPVGEKKLIVERDTGEYVESSLLSRGTAEQLYLAVRFALADEYARKGRSPLPIVMDDIFVNFDMGRLRSSLAVLERIGETHQIILFTCHRHVVDALRETVGNHQFIALEGVSNSALSPAIIAKRAIE